MKRSFLFLVIPLLFFESLTAQTVTKERTMAAMVLANKYFMEKWPDVGRTIITEPSGRGCFLLAGSELFKLK